jgi:c-di-GMP-binding flagellar brake protein YcgR
VGLEDIARKGNERRKHERCAADEVEAFYTTGILGLFGIGKQEAHVVDLSRGGALIRTAGRLKQGAAITLTITLEKYDDVIKARGVVRRSFTNPQDNRIYTGVEFEDLDAPLLSRLRAMCEYFNSPHYKNLRQQAQKKDPLGDFYLK